MVEKFSLCNLCKRASEDKCSLYRKDPSTRTIDCGRFDPDPEKTSFREALEEVMKAKGGLNV